MLGIKPVAKSAESSERTDDRTIGSYPAQTRWGDASETLQNAIASKVGRYGELDQPFIIALNTTSAWGTDREEAINTLFGSDEANPSATWRATKNTRLSGVIVANVYPWSMHKSAMCLYHNPFARFPCDGWSWRIQEAKRIGEQMQWSEGCDPTALFGLEEW